MMQPVKVTKKQNKSQPESSKTTKPHTWKNKFINFFKNFTLWETIDRLVNLFFIVELIVYFNLYEVHHTKLFLWLFWGHVIVFILWDVVFTQIKRKIFNFVFQFIGTRIFKKNENEIKQFLMTQREKQNLNQVKDHLKTTAEMEKVKQELKIIKHQLQMNNPPGAKKK